MSVQTVAFEDIILPPRSLRMPSIEDEAVIEMADDIAKRGILNIFTVYDNEDGTYSLGDGHHRYTALELMLSREEWVDGWESGKVEVNVQPKTSATDILANQLAGNVQKKDTKKSEYVDGLIYLQKELSLSLEELADKAGFSIDHIKNLIKTVRLPEDVREKISNETISLSNGVALAKLYNKVDEDKQKELEAFASRQTVTDFAKTISEAEQELMEARKAEAKARKESGEPVPAPVFQPKKQFIGKAALEEMLADAIENNSGSVEDEATLLVLKTAFSVDDASIAKQEEIWNAKQAEKEEKRAAKALERKQAKLAEDQKAIEEAQAALKA